MASFTETLSLIIDAKTGGAVRDVQAFGNTVKNTGDEFNATATKGGFLDKQLKNLGLTGIDTGNLVATGAAIAGTALGVFARDVVDTRLKYAGYARDFQRATGESAEVSSRMVAVFDDLEISQETAARGFFKLAREVGTSDEALNKFGVTVARDKNGNLDLEETMLRIAAAYTHTTDQGKRAALIQEAFGRGGKELIPILEKGRAGIEKLFANVPEGQVFTQEQLDQARRYELAMDDLGDAVDELKMSLADDLIPAIATFASGLAAVIRVGSEARGLLSDIADTGGAAGRALGESFLKGLPVVGPVVGFAGAVRDLGSAFGLGGEEADKLKDAEDRLADATKKVTELHNEGKDGSKEMAAAQRELADAKRGLAGESQSLQKALTDENDAMQQQLNLTVQRLGGTAGLLAADLAYQDAVGKRTAAQLKLNQLEADGKQGTFEYAAAQNDLAQSQVGIVQAATNVEGQLAKLREMLDKNEISTGEYLRRVEELKARYPGLGDAADFVAGRVRTLHGDIDDLPRKHHTELTGDASDAKHATDVARFSIGTVPGTHDTFLYADPGGVYAGVEEANRAINNLRQWQSIPITVRMQIFADIFGGVSRQHGGPIPGGINTAVPITAHGGEYVLSADVVQRIKSGRPSRGATVAGGSLGFDGGGGTIVHAPVNVQVHGWVGNDQDIANRLGSVFNRRGGPQLASRSIARSRR